MAGLEGPFFLRKTAWTGIPMRRLLALLLLPGEDPWDTWEGLTLELCPVRGRALHAMLAGDPLLSVGIMEPTLRWTQWFWGLGQRRKDAHTRSLKYYLPWLCWFGKSHFLLQRDLLVSIKKKKKRLASKFHQQWKSIPTRNKSQQQPNSWMRLKSIHINLSTADSVLGSPWRRNTLQMSSAFRWKVSLFGHCPAPSNLHCLHKKGRFGEPSSPWGLGLNGLF